ncbi:MAG TPA: hypothetical protein VHS96_05510 [Bacteroidia bacterium]|nr:hypothetical protein [Bacteroidia bacterium]
MGKVADKQGKTQGCSIFGAFRQVDSADVGKIAFLFRDHFPNFMPQSGHLFGR